MKNRTIKMKRLLVFVMLIIAISCTRDRVIKHVRANQKYKGTGVLYFRYLVSGSNHDMVFIPSKKVIASLDDIKSSDLGYGTLIWINNQELLRKLYKDKREMYPRNYSQEIDPKQRVLNYLNVYIEMSVGPQRFGLVHDTICSNDILVFKYIVPEDVVIDSIDIIK